jgi:hypothetical protein
LHELGNEGNEGNEAGVQTRIASADGREGRLMSAVIPVPPFLDLSTVCKYGTPYSVDHLKEMRCNEHTYLMSILCSWVPEITRVLRTQ